MILKFNSIVIKIFLFFDLCRWLAPWNYDILLFFHINRNSRRINTSDNHILLFFTISHWFTSNIIFFILFEQCSYKFIHSFIHQSIEHQIRELNHDLSLFVIIADPTILTFYNFCSKHSCKTVLLDLSNIIFIHIHMMCKRGIFLIKNNTTQRRCPFDNFFWSLV